MPLALAGQALAAMVAIAYRRRAHGRRCRLLGVAGGGAAVGAGRIGIWDEMGYGALIEVLLVFCLASCNLRVMLA